MFRSYVWFLFLAAWNTDYRFMVLGLWIMVPGSWLVNEGVT